jgi:hypothetical protein
MATAAPDHLRAAAHATNRVLSVLFACAIVLPLAVTLGWLALPHTDAGNPDLAPWPAAPRSVSSLGKWPTRFRRWFKDHYAFRRGLIQTHGAVLLRGFGVPPSPTVLIGRDGWWYYTDDGAMDDIVSAVPMPRSEMDAWRLVLEDNRNWLAEQQVPYLFVLAPDKHLVYPEYLPPTVRVLGRPRVEELTRFLEERSTVHVLDLRPPLLDAKRSERVFHRTDTHWNNRGSLVAYVEVMRRVARVRSGTPVPGRHDFDNVSFVGQGHDLPRMLGIERLVAEEILEVSPRTPRRARVIEPAGGRIDVPQARVVTEHPDRSLPRLVVFHDSFMVPVIPFLAESCSRCVFLRQRALDPEIVRAERPDLVIHQIVGRKLQGTPPGVATPAPGGPRQR